jgi:hypothetical protein
MEIHTHRYSSTEPADDLLICFDSPPDSGTAALFLIPVKAGPSIKQLGECTPDFFRQDLNNE